jgi:hypothetical protein
MFKNYFKTALRNLVKNKFYTSINIFGLAFGLATCLLILLYVLDELNFDRYNDKVKRIYRVNNELRFGGNHLDLAVADAVMGPTLLREFPQVEKYTRIEGHGSLLVKKAGQIIITFAILAILIGCLGLFGLVTYAAEQRNKEIGIRKVLGASVGSIAGMLSKDFLKLVIISWVVAFPAAWFIMNKWLRDFAYRISISWWVFAWAGLLALVIALLTVSFQAIRAAVANPAKSLKAE